jgi:HemY protein
MKWTILLVILLGLILSLGLLSVQDPGNVSIIWLGYEVRFTVVVGFCLLLIFLFLFNLLFGFLSWLFGGPFKWFSFFTHAQERKTKRQLLDFISSFEAETYTDALKKQQKIARRLSTNPIFIWFSGLAFEKAEKHLEAEMYFMDLIKNPASAFLGLKGHIRSAFHRQDTISAYDLLHRIRKLAPTSPWVLKHLLAVTREQQKFEESEALICRLEDLGYISPDESKKQLAHLFYQKALSPKTDDSQKETLLKQACSLNPRSIEASYAYALLLKEKGQDSNGLKLLEGAWYLNPHQKVGDLYLEIASPKNPIDVYQIAKKLTKNNASNPETLLFLARKAIEANLWGEARSHLMELLKAKEKPTARVYQLLANLEIAEHKDVKAAFKWLQEGIEAPRDIMHSETS